MPREFEKFRLTRRQVARREIDAAVGTLFTQGDPIAVNLLAWAAVDVLRGLFGHEGKKTFMALLEQGVRSEFVPQWRKLLKDHHNFLKHSEKDPERVVEDFIPEAATWALFAAVEDYGTLYDAITFPMHIFRAWFFARNPNLLKEDAFPHLKGAFASLGDLPSRSLRDSLQPAADVFSIYLNSPKKIWNQFEGLGFAIEW